MRLRLVLAGVVLAAALAATPATLASGGRNPQVAGLQVALRAQGLYRGPIDAISGPETVAAVRAFQRSQGLPVTGLADSRTRAAMGPLGGPLFGARTLHRGAFGWDVAVLQFLLVRQGISVPINAYFDVPTLHGVRVMQGRLHLRPDGVVGPNTFAALVKRDPVPLAHRIAVASHHSSHHHRHRTLTGVHVVRAGESLSSIARHFHTTVARLARLNHLDPSHFLLIGTRLRVPRVRHVAREPGRLSHPELRVGPCAPRPLGRALPGQRPSRPRARLDGVRLQQRARLVGRGARDHAAAAEHLPLLRERPDRPSRCATTRTATSAPVSPTSPICCTTSTATSASRSPAGTRARARSGSTACTK